MLCMAFFFDMGSVELVTHTAITIIKYHLHSTYTTYVYIYCWSSIKYEGVARIVCVCV